MLCTIINHNEVMVPWERTISKQARKQAITVTVIYQTFFLSGDFILQSCSWCRYVLLQVHSYGPGNVFLKVLHGSGTNGCWNTHWRVYKEVNIPPGIPACSTTERYFHLFTSVSYLNFKQARNPLAEIIWVDLILVHSSDLWITCGYWMTWHVQVHFKDIFQTKLVGHVWLEYVVIIPLKTTNCFNPNFLLVVVIHQYLLSVINLFALVELLFSVGWSIFHYLYGLVVEHIWKCSSIFKL